MFQAPFTSQIDIYDVNDPASTVGNSLASRVTDPAKQLIGDAATVYKKILWNSAGHRRGIVGDGGPANGGSGPEKSDDWTLL